MSRAFKIFIVTVAIMGVLPAACQAQSSEARPNLYACEGCEGVFERSAESLTHRAVMVTDDEPGEPMIASGTVYHTDGRTPAEGIIIYAYQTNAQGLYANGSDESQWSRRHGNIRGWVKTNAQGRYEFITIKPTPYPNLRAPAHLHFTILEPEKPPYWIDDIVFDGEFGVTQAYRANMTGKGGNGIVEAEKDAESVWYVKRDIILEHHPEQP